MAGVKYIARVGINFKNGGIEQRFEPGDVLPDSIPQDDIQALLDIRAIEEKKPKKKESK